MIRRAYAALTYALSTALITRVAGRRPPNFVVGADDPAGAYLRRWYLVPRNRWFNVYLHQFLRSDDDRALHDHPWHWASLLLRGSYVEHTIAAGGIHQRHLRTAGSIKLCGPRAAHRVEVLTAAHPLAPANERTRYLAGLLQADTPLPCWTLFITGPRVREWGFHCPEQGFIPWPRFTRAGMDGRPGEIGPGCDG